jgi:hypothetical protein
MFKLKNRYGWLIKPNVAKLRRLVLEVALRAIGFSHKQAMPLSRLPACGKAKKGSVCHASHSVACLV